MMKFMERTSIAFLVLTSVLGILDVLSGWLVLAGYGCAVLVALRGVDLHKKVEFRWRRDASR
jgi:hypothetical protein